MTRGLDWSQIGVGEAMIETFGDLVWERSNNVQVRVGDPVRMLDLAAIERQRAGLGLSDQQIAAELGLTTEQATLIRCAMESRRYHRGHFHRLAELGGNRRFRSETYIEHEDRDAFSAPALALRDALRFDPARVRDYLANGWWAADTLNGWLAEHVTRKAGQTMASGPAGGMTFAEFARQVERLAAHFRRLGLGRGDVVSVQLPNIAEFLIVYFAVTRLGAVMSTVHMPYRASETLTLLKFARSRMFVAMSAVKDYAPAAEVARMRAELPDLTHVIALGEPVPGTESLGALLAGECAGAPANAAVPADPFLLLFTSGTTSSPKAVPLTYQTILGNARLGATEHQLRADDVVLSASPYTHLLGLYSIHLALRAGAANLMLPAFSPADMLAFIERHRPTVLFTAPAHLASLRSLGLLQKADLSSLRLIVISGSACPPDLLREVAGKLPNGHMTQLWGMTELQAGLYTRPEDPIDLVATSAGRPCPGTEVRIVDMEDRPKPAGEEGELQIRGSSVFAGYFGNNAATRAAFTADGWFRTGDIATLEADGTVRITGRLKDVINRGGIKYNPADIENLINAHPKIMQAAVVAYPDPVLGERACCFAVLRDNERLTLDDLSAYLADKGIAKVKLPERLELIEELPMTPTRKVIKARLRDRLMT